MKVRAALTAIVGIVFCAAGLLAASPAQAASLQEITNFGVNPTKLKMYVYVPDRVPSHPAVLVGVHWCGGSGPSYYQNAGFAQLADRYGFVVVYPSVTRSPNTCWDVSSKAALTRDGGSDPAGIKSMIDWTMKKYNGDSSRVFVVGHSSGGMMTNVLLAEYPDVFRAGSASAGVPYDCFASDAAAPTQASSSATWNSDCAQGKIIKSAQQWGDLARSASGGYVGAHPRVMLWHGTADDTLNVKNFQEEIKMWTNVLGVSQTPSATDHPAGDRTRTVYKSSDGSVQVEANQIQGGPHNISVNPSDVATFFGLDGTPIPGKDAGSGSGGSGSSSGATNRIVSRLNSAKCLDIAGSSTANGALAQLWDCNGQANQGFTVTSSRQLQTEGKCLDALQWGATNGADVGIWDCNGQANQQWTMNADGSIKGIASGLCLDASGRATANGTPVRLWACNGQANQQWVRS